MWLSLKVYLDALVHVCEAGRNLQALLSLFPQCGIVLLEVSHPHEQLLRFFLLHGKSVAQLPAYSQSPCLTASTLAVLILGSEAHADDALTSANLYPAKLQRPFIWKTSFP